MIDNRSKKHPVEAQHGNSWWGVGGWMFLSSRGDSAGFSVRDFRRCTIRNGSATKGWFAREAAIRKHDGRKFARFVGALHFPYRRALRRGTSRGVREWTCYSKFLKLVSQRCTVRYVKYKIWPFDQNQCFHCIFGIIVYWSIHFVPFNRSTAYSKWWDRLVNWRNSHFNHFYDCKNIINI